MADFTALQAVAARIAAATPRVQAVVAASSDAAVQASIDSVTAELTTQADALDVLAPVPPVVEPAPEPVA